MANLPIPTDPSWPDVYILAETDPVAGGLDGVDNLPHRQLLERSEFLKKELAELTDTVDDHDSIISQLSVTSAVAFGRAFTLQQTYHDEGFDFELFSEPDSLSFRDFDEIAVTEVTAGDDSLDVVQASRLSEGETYILCDDAGMFVESFVVDRIITATRVRATTSFAHSFAVSDGASVRRSTFEISGGMAIVRHQDQFYSRVLKALHYWDQGRLVLRRTASGSGVFGVQYRAAGTEVWADAKWLHSTSRLEDTRDEEWEIGIGGDIELRIVYTGASPDDTDTLYHMILYTPPRGDTLSLVQQPSNSAPASEAVNVGETPTLQGSTYRSIYGLSQGGAEFQVAADPSFSTLILNTSTDFLASWVQVTQAETVQNLNALAMRGDGQGTAVGNTGAIIATADGGETWSAETADGTAHFYCVAQTSTMRLAGGATGTLEQSTNSGTWSAWAALSLTGGFVGAVRGAAIVGTNLLVVGDGGEIQTSGDGGTFWSVRAPGGTYTGDFHAVAMDGSGNAVAVGETGAIHTSNDFGVTWAERSAAGSYTGIFRAVSIDESGNVLIAGDAGEIQTSSDYGATWTSRTAAEAFASAFNSAVLTSDGDAVLVGAGGEIQTSDDGGVTWYQRTAAAAFANAFGGVDIDGNGDAVIVGDGGEVQRANRLDSATTTHTVPSGDDMLQSGALYWWRCRYADSLGNWSPWSTPTAFATSAAFDYIKQPFAISPADGGANISGVPTLRSSAFAFVGSAVTHTVSQWQISASDSFATIDYNSGEVADLTSHTVPEGSRLDVDTTYFWRVRHKSSAGAWSPFSVPARFETQKEPNAPTITAPGAGATVTPWPTITTGAFSFPGGGESHTLTRYQIAEDVGFTSIVFDSGEVTNLTSLSITPGTLDALTSYYVRAYHVGATTGASNWSSVVSFSTSNPIPGTPTLTSPTNGDGNMSVTPLLATSSFSYQDPGQVHASSRYQIATDAGFTSIVYDTGSINDLTSHTVAAGVLSELTTYYIRAQHAGASAGFSNWSPAVVATTRQYQPDAPMITAPSNGATVAPWPTISTSSFSAPGGSEAHIATRYQIGEDAGFNVIAYDSGEISDLTSYAIQPWILSGLTTYWVRAYHVGGVNGQSGWSSTVSFSTNQPTPGTPTLTSPANGASNLTLTPLLATSSFSYPDPGETHVSSRYQVATDAAFTSVVYDSGSVANLTSHTVPANELSEQTTYYARAQHAGSTSGSSSWTPVVAFATRQYQPNAPLTAAPTDGATNIADTTTLSSTAFSPPVSDSHAASQWQVSTNSSFTSIAYDSGEDVSNKTSITLPGSTLNENTTYFWRVRHKGATYSWSAWSAGAQFQTQASFWNPYDTASIGQPRAGGYFIGVMTYADGDYELIDAGKAAEASLQWKTSLSATSGTDSYHDGLANSLVMNNASHPAAQHCLSGTWGGQDDWYLPARDEHELRYRVFKPTTAANYTGTRLDGIGQHGRNANSVPVGAAYTTSNPARTAVHAFQEGGSEALNSTGTYYWTSTQYAPDAGNAWGQRGSVGQQAHRFKTAGYLVRPVRRLKI